MSILNNITEDTMGDYKAGPRKRRPTHPGQLVASSLEALGLTPYAAAPLLGISKQALGNVLSGKSAVSAEMALRLGRFFRSGPELWLRMQNDVDLWDAAKRIGTEVEAIEPADWEGREEFDVGGG